MHCGCTQRSCNNVPSTRQRPGPSFQALLQEGTTCGVLKVEAMCREIIEVEPAMWTFARIPGVEPTVRVVI